MVFWWCLEAPRPSNVYVWSSLVSCEAPAAPKPPGLHTTAREPKRAHLRVPVFTKKKREDTQRERQKEQNLVREREKRERNLDGPAEGGPKEGCPAEVCQRRRVRRKVGRTHKTEHTTHTQFKNTKNNFLKKNS